jgi:uroporphyrinogen decarboxylase
MTPRERVRAVLRGERPDRVPNGLGATLNTGMHLLAYERFRNLLAVGGPPPRMMSFEANALFDLPVMAAIGADMVSLGLKITPARFWAPGNAVDWKPAALWGREYLIPASWDVTVDGDGVTWIDGYDWDALGYNVQLQRPNCRLMCPQGGRYFDPVLLPGVSPDLNPTLEKYEPPHGFRQGWLEGLEQSARWLHENTDLSIVCDEMINDFQLTPGGLDGWWMKMATDPQTVHGFLEKACQSAVSQLRRVDQAVGKYADLLMIAQDFGDLRGVTIGPELWRQIFKPHFRDLFSEWHRISRMKIGMHSCGAIGEILGDLIECGLDVINPVQVSARGMEPESLVRRFGGRVVFYGGSYDAVMNDPSAPPEVVRKRVGENIRTLAASGRYIFCGVHNIQWNVPDSHLTAVLDAFRERREDAGA